MHLNPAKTGLAVGLFVGLVHVLWSIFVALNWAQAIVDFVFSIHMVRPVFVVQTFNLSTAILLIIVASAVGYAIGFVFANVWNRATHKH